MKGSLDLGSVSGIKIRVHWTFLLQGAIDMTNINEFMIFRSSLDF